MKFVMQYFFIGEFEKRLDWALRIFSGTRKMRQRKYCPKTDLLEVSTIKTLQKLWENCYIIIRVLLGNWIVIYVVKIDLNAVRNKMFQKFKNVQLNSWMFLCTSLSTFTSDNWFLLIILYKHILYEREVHWNVSSYKFTHI